MKKAEKAVVLTQLLELKQLKGVKFLSFQNRTLFPLISLKFSFFFLIFICDDTTHEKNSQERCVHRPTGKSENRQNQELKDQNDDRWLNF